MSVFAASSALVKLYADEADSGPVRAVEVFAVSALARVEVPAALWRKTRTGALTAEHAAVLVADFEVDWHGPEQGERRMYAVPVSADLLPRAARTAAVHGLRAYDAVQLASADALRQNAVGIDTFACFDADLRTAASAEGFRLLPR